jgi:hypothetical protein
MTIKLRLNSYCICIFIRCIISDVFSFHYFYFFGYVTTARNVKFSLLKLLIFWMMCVLRGCQIFFTPTTRVPSVLMFCIILAAVNCLPKITCFETRTDSTFSISLSPACYIELFLPQVFSQYICDSVNEIFMMLCYNLGCSLSKRVLQWISNFQQLITIWIESNPDKLLVFWNSLLQHDDSKNNPSYNKASWISHSQNRKYTARTLRQRNARFP